MANEPREKDYYRGVASVPQRHAPVRAETGSFPVVEPQPPRDDRPPGPGARPRRHYDLPQDLIVRRRWRRLRAGAPWTWSGLLTVLFCWGIWAVSLRGGDLLGPVIGLVVVLAVGGLLFVVARLLGRAVLEQSLGRERPSAWPSHMTVGLFLILAGITFLQQTEWIMDSWRWFTNLLTG